jgi:hypothetical protein
VAWFTLPAPAKQQPQPEVERLDKSGPGRGYKLKVKKRRTDYQAEALWAFGEGATLYLTEADARLHLEAGNVSLVDPPGLPARD